MNKEDFIEIIQNMKIAKITTFSISYKEYDLEDEPTMIIKLEEK